MDAAEFRVRGKEMIDYVADYLESIQDRPPLAQVQPGYLKDLIPSRCSKTTGTVEGRICGRRTGHHAWRE